MKYLFLLLPLCMCAQSYVMPNINGKNITADVKNDTLKITSLRKISGIEIFSDHLNIEEFVDDFHYSIPIEKMPIGKHLLSVIVDRKMIVYWLVIEGFIKERIE